MSKAPPVGKSVGKPLVMSIALLFTLSLAALFPGPHPARAAMSMDIGGQGIQMDSDGTRVYGPSDSQDVVTATPPRPAANATEALPYGIVPEVYVPWYVQQGGRPPRPGGGYHGQGVNVPSWRDNDRNRPGGGRPGQGGKPGPGTRPPSWDGGDHNRPGGYPGHGGYPGSDRNRPGGGKPGQGGSPGYGGKPGPGDNPGQGIRPPWGGDGDKRPDKPGLRPERPGSGSHRPDRGPHGGGIDRPGKGSGARPEVGSGQGAGFDRRPSGGYGTSGRGRFSPGSRAPHATSRP